MGNSVWTKIIFILYPLILIGMGTYFFKKTGSLSDYFIGGRRLNPWAAALSAFAADMSGWLFMGFPGAVYALGLGQCWIALGLALGTILSWTFVAKRLRRYTMSFNYSITIPEFFENRFRDDRHILRTSSAVFTAIFFTIYTASGFVACGVLFSRILGISYQAALLIGVLIILTYTYMGGFRALGWIDFFQGFLMLGTLIALPLLVLHLMGGLPGAAGVLSPEFLNLLIDEPGRSPSPVVIISGLSWGIGYLGMPHILVRFMAVKNERAVSLAALIAGVAVVAALGSAVLLAVLGLRFVPALADPDAVFIETIQKVFIAPGAPIPRPFLGGIFFCGIFAAIMSTADSQLLAAASVIAGDLFRGRTRRAGSDRGQLFWGRLSVVIISAVAYIIAAGRMAGIMSLVSSAWSGFGSSFGALTLLSLYWKRLNRSGAAAGILAGGISVIIWDYVPLVQGDGIWMTLSRFTRLYSLAPGFCVSLTAIILISLITKAPSDKICREFDIAAAQPIYEET
jgi:sodium/proline symporter